MKNTEERAENIVSMVEDRIYDEHRFIRIYHNVLCWWHNWRTGTSPALLHGQPYLDAVADAIGEIE